MPDRKIQILEVAEDLLLVKGFCGFSYADISERLGITKASIHHHFASKEDLGIALCDRFGAQASELAQEVERTGQGPTGLLRCLLEHGQEMSEQGDRCCPGGILQAEYESLPNGMRTRVDALFDQHHTMLTQALEIGREQGQFTFEGPASDQAWFLMSTMQGALLSARVHGPEVYQAVVRQIRSSLLAPAPA